jgi:hypothetical protein
MFAKRFVKAVTSAALAAPILLLSATSAFAAPVQVGVVEGLVSQSNGTALDNANVSVNCNSNVLNTTTDASGFYFVQYPNGVCVAGDTATVNAVKGGLHGSNSGVLTNQGDTPVLKLDIAVVHVLAVPEFTSLGGLIAIAASAGSFFLLRTRLA